MSVPLRNQLVAEVLARFQGIRTAAGYLTEAGAHVFLWRVSMLQQNELPGIVLRDRRVESVLEGRTVHLHRFFFEADLYAPVGTDVRNVLADVQAAVGKDIRWKTSAGVLLAIDTQPLDDELDAIQEERLVAGCRYRFQVILRTKPFNPFVLASPT
jgi:hypothetical protein